jgi:hypothetical protein
MCELISKLCFVVTRSYLNYPNTFIINFIYTKINLGFYNKNVHLFLFYNIV